jgi:hypothetical protein
MEATKRLRRVDNHFIAAGRMKHAHAIAIGWERFCGRTSRGMIGTD